jgi:hypothetical protein
MQIGDILKFTQLRAVLIPPDGVASEEYPAYLQVSHYEPWHNKDDKRGFIPCKFLWSAFPGRPQSYGNTGDQWTVANNDENRKAWGDGHYEFATEDEVPDFVWVELAREALIGAEGD